MSAKAPSFLEKYLPKSKKVRTFLANVVILLLNDLLGLGLTPDTIYGLLGISSAYVLAQGQADRGKEAKRLEIENGNGNH